MIIGLGFDLVELSRIRAALERFGCRFLRKMLHPEELAALAPLPATGQESYACPVPKPFSARIAARFAAKEAGVKALGSGFANGIVLHDLRIVSLPSGKPELTLHGKARERADSMGVISVHLSLSHARDTAGAVVILEK